MDGFSSSEIKEWAANSVRDSRVGARTLLGSFLPPKRKKWYICTGSTLYQESLGMCSLKERPAGAIGQYSP
jgi:hypothetical protein